MVTYEQFLQEKCKISFHMYVDKDSKTLKWRDLTGPEKLRLFKAIDIPQLFPKISHVVKVQELWTEFLEIYLVLQSTTALDNERMKSIRSHVKNWMTVYQCTRPNTSHFICTYRS